MSAEPLALYVHWPFCVSKCPYCDFNSHVRAIIDEDIWRDALLADLAHEARLLPGRQLTSIFFGGGTPSLMDPATVDAIIVAATSHWAAGLGHRDHPRSEPELRRGGPLRGSCPCGRQSAVARPAELRRRGAALPRPRPLGSGRISRSRDRAEELSSSKLRSDLRTSRRDRDELVSDPRPGSFTRARSTCRSTS